MSGYRLATVAALLAACGSSRPAADTATADVKGEPADAGVSIGRPSSGDAGPELPPTVVKSAVLESHRLTGNPQIEPEADDRAAISQSGKPVLVAVKLCVDTTGHVASVKLLKSSGRPGYDAKIEREAKSWTFRPVMGEGQPVDVCTVMTAIYRPPSAPATP